VQALITKFASDPAFAAFLNAETALTLPSPGSPAYENLLKETGRTNLENFSYEAHVQAITEATQLISKVGLAELLGVTDQFTGTSKNDVIRAGDEGEAILIAGMGNDTLIGGASDDVLIGGVGNDKMSGLAGNDIYYVDSTKDRVIEKAGDGEDTVVAQININKLANNIENVILLEGDIGVVGNVIANQIKGNDGVNKIDGGLGSDVLTGGAGADIFVFSSKLSNNNIDTITDFSGDKLHLSSKVFSKLKGKTDLSDFFVVGEAKDANDFLIYDNGILYYDVDGSGGKAAVAVVALTGQPTLTLNDFLII
jgi:Ca2+-binding RTX toxin-like protein